MSDEDELLDEIGEAAKRERGYADFDSWPDTPVRDRGVGEDFAASLSARDGVVLPSVEVVPQGEDPPDLWAGDIAIELTELEPPRVFRRLHHLRSMPDGS